MFNVRFFLSGPILNKVSFILILVCSSLVINVVYVYSCRLFYVELYLELVDDD